MVVTGAVAQLVERCLCKAEVRGSNPLGSTLSSTNRPLIRTAGLTCGNWSSLSPLTSHPATANLLTCRPTDRRIIYRFRVDDTGMESYLPEMRALTSGSVMLSAGSVLSSLNISSSPAGTASVSNRPPPASARRT